MINTTVNRIYIYVMKKVEKEVADKLDAALFEKPSA